MSKLKSKIWILTLLLFLPPTLTSSIFLNNNLKNNDYRIIEIQEPKKDKKEETEA